VPLSKFAPRGFGFVHHSIAILYHQVPNPNITIRNFFHRWTTHGTVGLACVQLEDTREATLATRAALRGAASAELVNIDAAERAKRKLIGAGAGVLALVAAASLTAGGVTNPLIRGAVLYLVRGLSCQRLVES
jgi:hypothetical protein